MWKWVPTSKKHPRVGVYVLLLYADGQRDPTLHARNIMAVGRYECGRYFVNGCVVRVSHWTYLPEPPEEV
jgi:hypothetical protein